MELLRSRGRAAALELAAPRRTELLRAAPDGEGGKAFKPFAS